MCIKNRHHIFSCVQNRPHKTQHLVAAFFLSVLQSRGRGSLKDLLRSLPCVCCCSEGDFNTLSPMSSGTKVQLRLNVWVAKCKAVREVKMEADKSYISCTPDSSPRWLLITSVKKTTTKYCIIWL